MTVDVWLVYPEGDPPTPATKSALAEEVNARGWNLQERPATRTRVVGGRPVHCLRPRDATALYRRAHRAHVGVLIVDHPLVNRDPSGPPKPSQTINIAKFLRYKGLTRQIGSSESRAGIVQFLDDLAGWSANEDCDGESDPRVLPLHVFSPAKDVSDLADPDGRRRFGDVFGHASRRDSEGRRWERAKALHGREVLHVAGRQLVAGFHWDVQNPKAARTRLATTHEVWALRQGAYVNVHPDSYVSSRDRGAKVVWQETSSGAKGKPRH